LAWQSEARRGVAGQGKALHGKSRKVGRPSKLPFIFKARLGKARRGKAWLGVARQGQAWLGSAKQGSFAVLLKTAIIFYLIIQNI